MKFIAPSFQLSLIYLTVILLTVEVSLFGTHRYDDWKQENTPPWLTYVGSPWKVKNRPHPGDAVLFDVTRCNSSGRARSYELSHFLVNLKTGERTILPPGLVPILAGCETSASAANVVPISTKLGMYFVEGNAEVDNGYRPTTVYWASQPFEVTPP